jgi:hypothetical protein
MDDPTRRGTPLDDIIDPKASPRDRSSRAEAAPTPTRDDTTEDAAPEGDISTEEVLAAIPEDNPFREAIRDLRADGAEWDEVWATLESAYSPVDAAVLSQRLGTEVRPPARDRDETTAVSGTTTGGEAGETGEDPDMDLGDIQ